MRNLVDDMIAGLAILRSKATEVNFYNSHCGNMKVYFRGELQDTERTCLVSLGWTVKPGDDHVSFGEGDVDYELPVDEKESA